MASKEGNKLNVNCEHPKLEEQLAELKKRIISKLTDGYGYELQDDTLSTWIIVIAIRNNKSRGEVQQELDEFISDNSEDFTNWLWEEVPKVCIPPEPEQSVMQDFIDEKKEPKPKVKSAVVVKSSPAAKSNPQNKTKKADNSINLVKKAIGDTKKEAAANISKSTNKKDSNLFVKKNEDGRKVITLNKQEKVGEHKTEEIEISQVKPEQETIKKEITSSNILDRLKTKNKDSIEAQGKCNLDMDLDSLIKKQKESERVKKDNYFQSRKRHHNDDESKPQVEEIDISESAGGNPSRVISLSKKNNNIRNLKRTKTEEEGESVEKEPEEAEGDKENPKGKYKKGGYYPPMGYMPPYYMYDYQMYGMDPYMMNPYSYKPKKNKTWVKKTNEEYSIFNTLKLTYYYKFANNLIILFNDN